MVTPRGRKGAAATLAVALLLAGCAASTSPAPAYKDHGGLGSATPSFAPSFAPSTPPPPAAVPSRPIRPDLPDDLRTLAGMGGRDVQAALGAPTVQRRDRGVQVWQYFGRDCVLDVFLYGDAEGWHVLHQQLRSTVAGQPARRECLQAPPRGLHPILRDG